jgi:hypothetical protein
MTYDLLVHLTKFYSHDVLSSLLEAEEEPTTRRSEIASASRFATLIVDCFSSESFKHRIRSRQTSMLRVA